MIALHLSLFALYGYGCILRRSPRGVDELPKCRRDAPDWRQRYLGLDANLGAGSRFEKSLYDLIRGLRNHKGNEKEYIQKSLKECRAEVRSQDMGWLSLEGWSNKY